MNETDLLLTTDAMVWAESFVATHGGDVGLMVAWFASAIETGRHAAEDRYEQGYNDGQRETAHALMGLDDDPSGTWGQA